MTSTSTNFKSTVIRSGSTLTIACKVYLKYCRVLDQSHSKKLSSVIEKSNDIKSWKRTENWKLSYIQYFMCWIFECSWCLRTCSYTLNTCVTNAIADVGQVDTVFTDLSKDKGIQSLTFFYNKQNAEIIFGHHDEPGRSTVKFFFYLAARSGESYMHVDIF